MKKTIVAVLLTILTIGLFVSCNANAVETLFDNSYKVQPDGSWKMGKDVYGPSTKPYILVLPKSLNVEKDVQLSDLQAGLKTLDEIRSSKTAVKIGNATVQLKYDDFGNEYYEYINSGDSSKAQNIFMRTTDNDFTETILLNAPNDEFSHYGSLNVATVGEVADNSYYEYGRVKKVVLSIGHLVAKAMSQIDMIFVNTNNATTVSVDVETTSVKAIIAPEGVAITKPESVPTVKTEDAKFMDEDGKFYKTFAETKGSKVTLLGSVKDLSIERTVEIDMFGNEIKGTTTIAANNTVTFSDSVGNGALNSKPKGDGTFKVKNGNYGFNPKDNLKDKEGTEVKAIDGKTGYYKVAKKAATTTPTPTPKTISVKEDDTEKFSFVISTIPSTTWEEVIGSGLVKDDWKLSVNDKNGRLELTDGTTTYFVTTKIGEEFINSTDTIGDTETIYIVNPKDPDYTLIGGYDWGYGRPNWFSTLVGYSGITQGQITEICFDTDTPTGTFVDNCNGVILTEKRTGKVKGYVEKVSDTDYKIYIVGDYIFGDEDCSRMFYSFTKLTTLDLSNFDTSSVTDMNYMFSGCAGLKTLDLSNFDTSNVTTMENMFDGCSKLTSLNVSKFNTSNVTNMSYMFNNCTKLPSLDLSNFDTSKVENMDSMFKVCSSLTDLNLSNFDTSKVKNMGSMFYQCKSLIDLDLSSFDTSSVTSMFGMFKECSSLTKLNLSSFNKSSVTTMESMFQGCSGLTSLDLSNFDTSKVTTMKNMFQDCSKLTSLALRSFNTSNVTSMYGMFQDCSKLKSLDLSNFDTSNVTNMSYMFNGCLGLTSLDLSNFNTSNVTNMRDMFCGCSSLETLDLSSFNTSSVNTKARMFDSCGKTGAKITVNTTNMVFFETTELGYKDDWTYKEGITSYIHN